MLNKVFVIGNLGHDPEVRFTQNGKAVARFSVAATEKWNEDGQPKERTEWFNVVVWGKSAENCGKYLAKGKPVFVEGSLRTRHYEDKEGTKRYITEVIAQRVQFLGAPKAGESRQDAPPPSDDDIPF